MWVLLTKGNFLRGWRLGRTLRINPHRRRMVLRARSAGITMRSVRQGDNHPAESLVGEFLARQLPGNHTGHEAATLQHSICQHTHQSDATATVNQPDALGRHQSP